VTIVVMGQGQVTGDAFVFELGKLAILAGNVESHVDWIVQVLVEPDSAAGVGFAVAARHQFRGRVDLARTLVPMRLGPEASPAHDLATPIEEYLRDASEFMQTRNQLLHAIWMIYATEGTATILRRRAKEMETEDLSLTALQGHVAEGERLARVGGQLWEELIARYGHLDALIAATERMMREESTEE
jgi:hypothetical protein